MSTPGPGQPGEVKTPRIARFGQFELNARTGELLRKGHRVRVQDQPFRVLLYLVERPNEIVSREELRTHLWPEGTFVDFEHSLNTAIKKLRKVLGDDAENSRFVETLPRRGYRFIAPVDWGEVATPVGSTVEVAVPPLYQLKAGERQRSMRGTLSAISVVTVLAIATLLWQLALRPAAPPKPLSVTPLTTYPGTEEFGELSPDGQSVVFAWDENKNNLAHIYVKQVGAEQPLQITKSQKYDYAPTWSPDGKYIAFMRADNFYTPEATSGIYLVPALGGGERLLTTSKLISRLGPQNFPRLSWSPDGKTLAFVDRTPAGNNFCIMLLSVDTLERRQLTVPPVSTLGDAYPSFSPDGKSIAFIRTTSVSADVFTVPVSGGTPTQITNEKHITLLGLAWTNEGKSIIYGGFGMWEVSAKGGRGRSVMPVTLASSLSIRGDKMVFSQHVFDENIYGAELDGMKVKGEWKKEFASSRAEEGTRFSPDGTRVAFQSSRSGNYEIWVASPDGSNPIKLTSYNGPLTGSPRWSPDGQKIIYDSRPDGNSDIFVVGVNGGPSQRLTQDKSDEVMPSYSHDGKWIYYASDHGGTWNVWKMPAAGGTATQITHQGGFTPIESADGKYIYYAKSNADAGIWRVPVNGGDEQELLADLPPGLYGYWVPFSDGIYFIAAEVMTSLNPTPPTPILSFYSFATKKVTSITQLSGSPFTGAPGLEISPDRKHAYVVMGQDHGSDLQLVENFR